MLIGHKGTPYLTTHSGFYLTDHLSNYKLLEVFPFSSHTGLACEQKDGMKKKEKVQEKWVERKT